MLFGFSPRKTAGCLRGGRCYRLHIWLYKGLSDAELGNIECISAWPVIFDIQESRLSTCNVEYWRDDGPFPSKDGILAAVIDKISARCIL